MRYVIDLEFRKKRQAKDKLYRATHRHICNACHKRNYTTEKGRKWNLKHVYGISPEDKESLLLKQGGKCALCQKTKRLVVDHNHDTGAIRGLLCHGCNTGLGHFEKLLRLGWEKIQDYLHYGAQNTSE